MNNNGYINTGAEEMGNVLGSFRQSFFGIGNVLAQAKRSSRKIGLIRKEQARKEGDIGYKSMMKGLADLQKEISNTALQREIQATISGIEGSGGRNIKGNVLANLLKSLRKDFNGATGLSATDKGIASQAIRILDTSIQKGQKAGFSGVGRAGRQFQYAATEGRAIAKTDDFTQRTRDMFNNYQRMNIHTGNTALDKKFNIIRGDYTREAGAATTLDEKLEAFSKLESRMKGLAKSSKGSADEAMTKSAFRDVHALAKDMRRGVRWDRFKLTMMKGSQKTVDVLGKVSTGLQYIGAIKPAVDASLGVFKAFNGGVNSFARKQMSVSATWGAYGRGIRGAGMDFGETLAAIRAGRTAGMDDQAVFQKMIGLQGQLAQARWGEGPLINQLGRWGLSPFQQNGEMKSNHEIMIEISRKLNSITNRQEKLQFLQHQNFSPDQMEYVANYEREAARWEAIKGDKSRQGILESAQILDESGRSARIDAATKIELKRREILNQQAYDKGLGSMIWRYISNPTETWLMQDWTARQQGVSAGRSEKAMDKLSKELERLSKTIGDEGITGVDLSAKDLRSLGLQGGWAQAQRLNLGDKAGLDVLERAIEKQQKRSWWHRGSTNQAIHKTVGGIAGAEAGAAVGSGVGALTGLIGGLTYGAIAGTAGGGPIGALIGALAGGIIGLGYGAYAGASATNSPTSWFGDSDIDEIKKVAKKGSTAEWEKLKKERNLTALKRSVAASKDFDSEALQGAWLASAAAEVSQESGKAVDPRTNVMNDKWFKIASRGVDEGSEQWRELYKDALRRTVESNWGVEKVMSSIAKDGIPLNSKDLQEKIEKLTKAYMDGEKGGEKGSGGTGKTMGENEARAKAKEEVEKNELKEADKNGDLVKATAKEFMDYTLSEKEEKEYLDKRTERMHNGTYLVGDDRKKRLHDLSEFKTKEQVMDKGRLWDEAFQQGNDLAIHRHIRKMAKAGMNKDDFVEGMDEERASEIAYNSLYGAGGQLEGQGTWEVMPDAVKRKTVTKWMDQIGGPQEGESAEDYLARLGAMGAAIGAKKEDIANYMLSSDYTGTQADTVGGVIGEVARMGSKYKQAKADQDRLMQQATEEHAKESEIKSLDKMRKAALEGGNIDEMFGAEAANKYREGEEAEKKEFFEKGLGDEHDYKAFKELQAKKVRGLALKHEEKAYDAIAAKLNANGDARLTEHEEEEDEAAEEEVYTPSESVQAALAQQDQFLNMGQALKNVRPEIANNFQDTLEQIQFKSSNGQTVGSGLIEQLNKQAAAAAQMINTTSAKTNDAENAAASANILRSISGKQEGGKNININVGGVTVNQENQGVDMDFDGMKSGAEEGALAGGNKVAQAIVDASTSQGIC